MDSSDAVTIVVRVEVLGSLVNVVTMVTMTVEGEPSTVVVDVSVLVVAPGEPPPPPPPPPPVSVSFTPEKELVSTIADESKVEYQRRNSHPFPLHL